MYSLVMAGFQYPENPAWSVQDDERQGMLDSLKGIKKMWPIVRIMQIFSPSMRDIMRGFIFEEDDKSVGLINYMSPPNRPNEWMIANVTVLPEYRRRGIARKLVDAVMNTLRERKSKLALLEVIEDNLPAFNLYKELGFEPYVSETQYDCMPEVSVPTPVLPEGWSVSPLSDSDWRIRYELALRVIPEHVKQYEPVTEKSYKIPVVIRVFGNLFESVGGTKSMRLVLRTPSGEVAGSAFYSYRTKPGGVNNAGFVLHPDHAEIAPLLFQTVLSKIQRISPARRIQINITDWQPALVQAAEGTGCSKRIRAYRMGLKFAEN
jgi:GNAT superfamily N-acetyltransferase